MTANTGTACLVNWLFWSGAAIGAVVFVALIDLTGGSWAGRIRDIARRFNRFLIVSLVAYVALVVRAPHVYGRGLAALAIVYAIAFWVCRSPASRTHAAVALLIAYVAGFSVLANDVILSLDPEWISTLFPAYTFVANVYGGIAMVAAIALLLDLSGGLAIEDHQRRDLGIVIVAFALLWMYLVWSQYLV